MAYTRLYYPWQRKNLARQDAEIADLARNASTGGGSLPIAPPPVISPASQSVTNPFLVTITTVLVSGTIYYTLDGSEPNISSIQYIGPFNIPSSLTLKAVTVAPGYANSPSATETYVITAPQCGTPTFDPIPGVYSYSTSVIITSLNATTIYFTVDGSPPTVASPVWPGIYTVSTTTVIRAIGVAVGFSQSDEGVGLFEIQPNVLPCIPDPPSGTVFTTSLDVTATCATPFAQIYYTTDGITNPTQSDTALGAPVTITAPTTFKFRAFRAGYGPGAIATASYTGGGGVVRIYVGSCASPIEFEFGTHLGYIAWDVSASDYATVPQSYFYQDVIAGGLPGPWRYYARPINDSCPRSAGSGGFQSGGFNLGPGDFAGNPEGYNFTDANGWPYYTDLTPGNDGYGYAIYRLKNPLNGDITLTVDIDPTT